MGMVLLDRPFSEAELEARDVLDLRNVGSKVWPVVLRTCQAADLRLYHVLLDSLDGIERLVSVKRLELEWAPKIADLVPVLAMTQLTRLCIFDFARLRSLEGIEALSDLVELELSGNRGSLKPLLQLASLEPVTRLARLEAFSLTVARLEDDDITVLARCSRLKRLHLAATFERAQLAYLAKHLNPQLEEPLTAGFETRTRCDRCGGDKFMFVGRRMPVLCRTCDAKRFEKLVTEFDRLVRDA